MTRSRRTRGSTRIVSLVVSVLLGGVATFFLTRIHQEQRLTTVQEN